MLNFVVNKVPRSFQDNLSLSILLTLFLTAADTLLYRTKFLNLPQWVTPALSFNNTTSLPLLLVQSLQSTGILDSLDASSDTIDRAKSYFLVNAMVSNSLTFALGPRLLNGQNEDSPDEEPKRSIQDEDAAVP
jgi:hypothetical protein